MLTRFTLGFSLAFRRTLAAYPASAGWVLKHRLLVRSGGGAPIEFTAAADGDAHVIDVPAATTAAWAPGQYSFVAWVELGADVHQVEQGSVDLVVNPLVAAGGIDLRTPAQIALENVRAVLQGKASADVFSYTIGGRSLQRYSVAELVQLESKLSIDVQRENRSAALAAGRPDPRRLQVRIGRA